MTFIMSRQKPKTIVPLNKQATIVAGKGALVPSAGGEMSTYVIL
jgi:hypothetical protein